MKNARSNPPQKTRAKKHRSAPLTPENKAGIQAQEQKLHGSAACMMIWRQRPDDISRVYVQETRIKEFRPILKWAADKHKAYHVVAEEDLQRLTESSHHQGICVIARQQPPVTINAVKQWLKSQTTPQMLVYLDGVENPHNLGAIVRSCAHFNIPYILGDINNLPGMSASACRVAEGGAEFVQLVPVKNSIQQLNTLKEMGCQILAATMRGKPVYHHRFKFHTVLILGAEVNGVSKPILEISSHKISIPGSRLVESLNVSVAFSVIAAEFFRQGNFV